MARILSTQFQLNDSEEHLGIFLQGLEDDFYPIARRQRDASIIPVVGLCSKRKGQTVQLQSHTLNNWCCSSPLINFIFFCLQNPGMIVNSGCGATMVNLRLRGLAFASSMPRRRPPKSSNLWFFQVVSKSAASSCLVLKKVVLTNVTGF